MDIDDIDELNLSRAQKKARNRKRVSDPAISIEKYGPGTSVVIYTRVSSDEQVEGFSLDAQLRVCTEFAEKRGWVVVKTYSDEGLSAKDDVRTEFKKMILAAEKREFGGILVHKLDRFMRNLELMLRYFKQLNDQQVFLASATEPFDFSTNQGSLLFGLLALFSEWYLKNLGTEIIKGKDQRARQGLPNGQVPLGYRRGSDTKSKPALQLEEAAAVRTSFEMYATGQFTDRKIAEYLNSLGLQSFNAHNWSKDSVRELLQNPYYYGMVVHNGQLFAGIHEPIIDKELFDKCLVVRRGLAGRVNKTPRVGVKDFSTYLLQRIIKCPQCHRPLRIQTTNHYHYYKEVSLERGRECVYGGRGIKMELADRQIINLLGNIKLPKDWQGTIEKLADEKDIKSQIEKQRSKVRERIRRLDILFAQPDSISPEQYQSKRDALFQELQSLTLPDGTVSLERGLLLESLGDYLKEATQAELSEICHLVFEDVYPNFDTGKIAAFKPNIDFQTVISLAAAGNGWIVQTDGSYKLP